MMQAKRNANLRVCQLSNRASAPIVPLIILGVSEESLVGSGMQLEF
ncbi:MAG: hypothetical protein Q7J76_07240 [Candidatus Brocadiaceae bacterium]|nr:hypothetical protein [Candidatus Brocadiaceae bacterium]